MRFSAALGLSNHFLDRMSYLGAALFGNLRERQVASLEQALDRPAKNRDPHDELPGYG